MVPRSATGADRRARRLSLYLIWLLSAAALGAFAWNWSSSSLRPIVRADPQGYSVYLPAYFVDHDATLRTLAARKYSNDPTALRVVGLRVDPASGGVLEKYTLGVAVFETPMFLLGHGVALLGGGPADGASQTEQELTDLTGIVAGVLGLLALRAILLRRFTPNVTLATLACVCVGTSLFNYIGYDSGFSHAFSFAAIAAALLAALRWLEAPASLRRAAMLGASVGVVALIRPTNALVLLGLPLLGVDSRSALAARARLVRTRAVPSGVVLGSAVAAFAPQLLAWHVETGRWLVSPYPPEETFNLLRPDPGALFSFNPHGLLPFAPVLVLAIAGVVVLWRQHRGLFWPVVLGLTAQTWLIASWYAWWYGSAFGQRGFVDVMALFAIPLAAAFQALPTLRWRMAVGAVAAVLTATTMVGAIAYWRGRLPLMGADPSTYLHALLG